MGYVSARRAGLGHQVHEMSEVLKRPLATRGPGSASADDKVGELYKDLLRPGHHSEMGFCLRRHSFLGLEDRHKAKNDKEVGSRFHGAVCKHLCSSGTYSKIASRDGQTPRQTSSWTNYCSERVQPGEVCRGGTQPADLLWTSEYSGPD